ncbi:MAG: hypothetical protein Q9M36_05735 [Sulfurovum sp.]|nr:hypothetical protein [Sulfurovum sp.]
MNYSQILKDLEEATLFDLYRLTSALQEEMESVEKIRKVRSSLRVGQVISWFESSTHRLVKAQILKLNKTRCLVESIESAEKWNIVYASINTDDKAIHINMNQKKGLKKSELSVGDTDYLSQ